MKQESSSPGRRQYLGECSVATTIHAKRTPENPTLSCARSAPTRQARRQCAVSTSATSATVARSIAQNPSRSSSTPSPNREIMFMLHISHTHTHRRSRQTPKKTKDTRCLGCFGASRTPLAISREMGKRKVREGGGSGSPILPSVHHELHGRTHGLCGYPPRPEREKYRHVRRKQRRHRRVRRQRRDWRRARRRCRAAPATAADAHEPGAQRRMSSSHRDWSQLEQPKHVGDRRVLPKKNGANPQEPERRREHENRTRHAPPPTNRPGRSALPNLPIASTSFAPDNLNPFSPDRTSAL